MSSEDVTATGGLDYKVADGGTLQFNDAVSPETKDESIAIYTDFQPEGPETFKIKIASSSDSTSIVEPSEAVVIILDSGTWRRGSFQIYCVLGGRTVRNIGC